MEFVDGHEALIPTRRAERFSNLTHICISLAKEVFLFSHGVLLCNVGSYVGSEDANWKHAFLPAWLGNSLTVLLLVGSWFASCPYIKLCLHERQPQVNENPSILTEIFPSICMAGVGLIFVLCVIIMEFTLCDYLTYRGTPSQSYYEKTLLAASTLCFSLCLLHGACLKRNTALYATTSVTGFATIFFLECGHIRTTCVSLAILPLIGGTAVILFSRIAEMKALRDLLIREERFLRGGEAVLLGVELVVLLFITISGASYAVQGVLLGLPIVGIALLRSRMLWHEFSGRVGTIEGRILKKVATQASESRELVSRLRV